MQRNQVEFTPRMQGFFNICKLIKGTLKSLLQQHSSKALILQHSAFCIGSSHIIHDYWKNHSFDYMDVCQQNDVSDF